MTSSGATHTGEFEEFEDGEVLGLGGGAVSLASKTWWG
jgi:hypothetical protein